MCGGGGVWRGWCVEGLVCVEWVVCGGGVVWRGGV